jgi:hypothetical protein
MVISRAIFRDGQEEKNGIRWKQPEKSGFSEKISLFPPNSAFFRSNPFSSS